MIEKIYVLIYEVFEIVRLVSDETHALELKECKYKYSVANF